MQCIRRSYPYPKGIEKLFSIDLRFKKTKKIKTDNISVSSRETIETIQHHMNPKFLNALSLTFVFLNFLNTFIYFQETKNNK